MPFSDFTKLEIKIGQVVEVERVEGSKRLVKVQINIGGENKQAIAGVGDQYKPEDLKSKLVVVVTNLEPKVIMGLKSEVMLLAATDGSMVSLLQPDRQVQHGSKVT